METVGFEGALEDRILDTDAIVFAEFGHFVEAFVASDIVSDDDEHVVKGAAVAALFGWGGFEGKGILPPAVGWGECERCIALRDGVL